MIKNVEIDSRLKKDCLQIAELELSLLLLMNNALVPWFILVPKSNAQEVIDLSPAEQLILQNEITQVSRFIQSHYLIDKLNTGAIGNIVSQLHIHIIGRSKGDYCWPNVVWGNPKKQQYSDAELETIKINWVKYSKDYFGKNA